MNYQQFVSNLSNNLLDRLPYQRIQEIRRSKPSYRFGRELSFSEEEMDRFLEVFEETFGFAPLPQSSRQLVTMQELHRNVEHMF